MARVVSYTADLSVENKLSKISWRYDYVFFRSRNSRNGINNN